MHISLVLPRPYKLQMNEEKIFLVNNYKDTIKVDRYCLGSVSLVCKIYNRAILLSFGMLTAPKCHKHSFSKTT